FSLDSQRRQARGSRPVDTRWSYQVKKGAAIRRLLAFWLILVFSLFVNERLFAFQKEAAPAGAAQWNFSDDDAVPSWADDLKDQAADLALFVAFAGLALVSFFRKSELLKWITMGTAVIYLGFVRSQLITVVNIFGLVVWNLPV